MKKIIIFSLLIFLTMLLLGCNVSQLADALNSNFSTYKGKLANLSLPAGAKELLVAQSGDGTMVTADVSSNGDFSITVPKGENYVLSFLEDSEGDGDYELYDGVLEADDSSGETDFLGSKGGEINCGTLNLPEDGSLDIELADNFLADFDTDEDGVSDYNDTDCDGNSVLDSEQEEDLMGADDDIASYFDTDDDNDDLNDSVDTDDNGDGVLDSSEPDSDGDGLSDSADLVDLISLIISIGLSQEDTDGDGIEE